MHRRIDYPSYSWTKHLHYLTWWEKSFTSNAAFESHFSHLVSLCYEEYWGRLWIIQEVCLARDLQILRGRRMLDWQMFHTYRMIISITHPQRADYLSNLLTRISHFNPESTLEETIKDPDLRVHTSFPWALDHIRSEIRKKSGSSWDTLIALSNNSLCQDPRDKIYGLLGLAGHRSQELIAVDYNKSLFEVYINTLKAYISENPDNSIVTFSHLLQQALLFPDEKDAGLAELVKDRRQAEFCEGERISIPLVGREIGVIEAVSTSASILIQAARKIWKSPDPKRRKAKTRSEYIQACWMAASMLTSAQTDTVCAIFVTDSRRMGICTSTAVEGDILFVLSGRYEVPLIVDKNTMKVKGRAYIAKEGINTNKGVYMYLPEPEFAPIAIQCGALPIRPDLEELEKTVTVNECELQAMSYPVDIFKPKHTDDVKEPVTNS